MDLATIVLIGCVLFFALRGFQAGLIKACGRVLAIIAGYSASLLLTPSLSSSLGELLSTRFSLELSPLVSMLGAAIGLFIVAGLLVNLLVGLLLKRLPTQLPDSWPFKLGGAGVGATAGFVVAVLLMWLLSLFMGAQSTPLPEQGPLALLTQDPNSLASQVIEKTTQSMAERVSAQMDSEDMIAKAVATLMLQPGDTIASLKRLSQSEDLQSLLNNRDNQRALMIGDTAAIQALPDYQRILNNPDMRRVFDPTEASDEQLANTFATLFQRSQAMQHDPEIQKLLQDPELREQLESNNPIALLTNPKATKLLQALLQPPQHTPDPFIENTDSMLADFDTQRPPSMPQVETEQPAQAYSQPASREYQRWVDAEGQVHFGDPDKSR